MTPSILFLDIDGVIRLEPQFGTKFKKPRFRDPDASMDEKNDDWCPKAVAVLKSVVTLSGCDIVVTSDWVKNETLERMQQLFRDRAVKPPVDMLTYVHYTNMDELEKGRVDLIEEWLAVHPEVTKWAVVDDMPLPLYDRFVWCTDAMVGLAQPGLKFFLLDALSR